MLNLDHSIAQWRRDLTAAGLHDTATLDELESHLRDVIAEQTRAGHPLPDAFRIAVRSLGQPEALKTEFARSNPWRRVRPIIAGVLIISGLLAVYSTLRLEMDPSWKTAGFANAALLLLCYPLFLRLLNSSPIVPPKTTAIILAFVAGILGIAAPILFITLALPTLNFSEGQISVLVLWMLTLMAAMGGLTGWAAEQNARRHTLLTHA